MPVIACTQHLREVGPGQPRYFPGATVRQALQAMAEAYPRLPSYILNDQGEVRQHVAIFLRGELQNRRQVLDQPVGDQEEIFIMQALSGG